MVFLTRKEMLTAFISMCLAVTVGASSCPEDQIWHQETSTCCVPTFDCDIDSEVEVCTVAGEADQCVSCGDGRTNGYVTSSLDYTQHRCFNKTKQHIACPHGDTVPIATYLREQCPQPCRCRHEDCYYGDSCACELLTQPCGLDEELDPNTGTCVSCPEGKHKPVEGCQLCTWKKGSTAWMKFLSPTVDIPHTTDKKNEEPGNQPLSNPGYSTVEEAEDKPALTDKQKQGDKEGLSIVAVIILIVVLVTAGILIAVFLVILRRKIKSGDTTSRLVVCYNKLTGSGSSPQDAEAGNVAAGGAAAPREEGKAVPVQEVTPMTQSNVSANAATSPGETAPEMNTLQQLETSPTEPQDDDEAVNTTTTPLIGGTELELDETEQKTKE